MVGPIILNSVISQDDVNYLVSSNPKYSPKNNIKLMYSENYTHFNVCKLSIDDDKRDQKRSRTKY